MIILLLIIEKTYFYYRDRFWRYNETSKRMDEGYPQHMEKWRGVPENLDAATTWKDGRYLTVLTNKFLIKNNPYRIHVLFQRQFVLEI